MPFTYQLFGTSRLFYLYVYGFNYVHSSYHVLCIHIFLFTVEIKEFLSLDLSKEYLQPVNEKKRNDLVRLIDSLLINVHSVNPSVRPRMNTPSTGSKPPPLTKPSIKPGGPAEVPRTLSPANEDDDQEEYLPMQPGSPEIEPEDYEAPNEVVMPDGTTLGSAQTEQEALADELYEELPAEDGAQGNNAGDEEPEDYEIASTSTSSLTNNAVPLPPKPSSRISPEPPGYQATGKAAEDTDGPSRPEVWQYARTMKDKRISTSDLKMATCKGSLEKLGGRGHNTWQKRFCVLDGPLMYFFKDEKSKNFNNLIEAGSYNVSEAPDKTKEKKHQFAFKLTCRESGKDYYFRTTSADHRAKWMSALLQAQTAPLPTNSPLATSLSETQLSMHTMKRPSISSTSPAPPPAADEPEQESYEEVVAMGDRIPSEDASDEERFEQKVHQPRAIAPPLVPKMPPPPPPTSCETFDVELYDEHPQAEGLEEEEEYLACETQMQQDIIESVASPIEIVVDTDRMYEAPSNGVDLEKVYMSLYNFTAEEDDEMTIQRGDLVFVPDNATNSDWWLAELVTPDIVKTNKKGFCPANFLTLAFEQL